MGPTVAIFGGSFNPPHVAHVQAIEWVLVHGEVGGVDKVLVVPTFVHPFSKQLAPYDDRVAMCELAFGDVPRTEVSRVEEELGGESRTLRTLEHLATLHPEWRLRLVMGADLLLEANKWFRFDKIQELAPPLLLGRVGFEVEQAPRPVVPGVSSTDIRAKVAAGQWSEVGPLVPTKVLEYLRSHPLYPST